MCPGIAPEESATRRAIKILIEINQETSFWKDDPKAALRGIFERVAESNVRGMVEGAGYEPDGATRIYSYRVLEHTLPDGTVRKP